MCWRWPSSCAFLYGKAHTWTMRVLRSRKSGYASVEMARFQQRSAKQQILWLTSFASPGRVLLVSLASLQVKREQRKGLRPILFNPCSAPATPTQTWGTRPGGKDSAESSASLLMTKSREGVSRRNRLEGSQVSKARPGAPFDFTLRYCRGHKLCHFSPDSQPRVGCSG
jgi:hypothetical protein